MKQYEIIINFTESPTKEQNEAVDDLFNNLRNGGSFPFEVIGIKRL